MMRPVDERAVLCRIGGTGQGLRNSIHLAEVAERGARVGEGLEMLVDFWLVECPLSAFRAASSDRLRDTQLGFLEAALELGFEVASFAVVEYRPDHRGDAPARMPRSAPPGAGSEPARATDPELDRLIEDAANAPPDRGIDYRDRVAAFGAAAIATMERWVESGRSPGFACSVLEATARTADPIGAAHALRRLRAGQPSWVSNIDPASARVEAAYKLATAER